MGNWYSIIEINMWEIWSWNSRVCCDTKLSVTLFWPSSLFLFSINVSHTNPPFFFFSLYLYISLSSIQFIYLTLTFIFTAFQVSSSIPSYLCLFLFPIYQIRFICNIHTWHLLILWKSFDLFTEIEKLRVGEWLIRRY